MGARSMMLNLVRSANDGCVSYCGHPRNGRNLKRSGYHHERRDDDQAGRRQLTRDTGSTFFTTKINFENSERQEERAEAPDSEKWTCERVVIETSRAVIYSDPEKRSEPEEPDAAEHHEKSERPPAVRGKLATHGRAQRERRERKNEQRVERARDVLRQIADGTANPDHIQAR